MGFVGCMAVGVLVWSVLTACEASPSHSGVPASGRSAAPPASQPVPQSAPQTQPRNEDSAVLPPMPSAKAAPVVTFLDAGEAPHRVLRYAATVGQKQIANIVIKTATDQKFGGRIVPSQTIPTTTYTLEAEVREVSADGGVSYDYRITRGDALNERSIHPFTFNRIQKLAKGLEGVTGSTTISSRGEVKKASINVPPSADPQIAESLRSIKNVFEQLLTIFPDQPLGVGGRWQVALDTDANPNTMRVLQTAVYQVASISDDEVKLNVQLKQEGRRQDYRPPGTAPNVAMQVVTVDGVGTGEISLVLAELMPRRAKAKIESNADLEVSFDDKQDFMLVHLIVENAMESASVPNER
jgi:hypothetical protein